MKYAMLIDQTKCIGCGACTVECKGKYEASFGVLRTSMIHYEIGSYPNVKAAFRKQACMHCKVAACEEICPVKAIYRVEGENGGMVVVDKETCLGCGACASACPFGVPQVDPGAKKMEKCSFCAQRVVNGKSTYCAEACPVGAIDFGEREKLIAQGEERVKALKSVGRSKAAIYGKDDTGVLLIIDGDPGNFGLVPEGFTLSAAGWQAINSYGGLAVAAALGGLGYRLISDRLEEVKKEKN
ncbi:MAG: 4Fe-4S dicluster domain-containing protein [Dethiobacter sp.]|jgi:formate dehydrogenase iron-sulfur subunit|nr:MAG: 4Fe-4S dicluster domain-containing protein [Dethiobacter sp.]